MDRAAIIKRDAGLLAGRVEFLLDAPVSTIDDIALGVFFIMAFWSGGSRQSFARLVHAITTLDPSRALRFVVADTDEIPHFYESPRFKGTLHGWGETFWIKNGQIVSDSGIGLNLECIVPNTTALLQMKS